MRVPITNDFALLCQPVAARGLDDHGAGVGASVSATNIGGGLGIRVASLVSVDTDLRMFRLLGEQDRNVCRFGVGVRHRF